MDGKTENPGMPVAGAIEGGPVGAGTRPESDGTKRPADPESVALAPAARRPHARNRAALVSQARFLFEAGRNPKDIARETGLSDKQIRRLATEQKWASDQSYARVVTALNDTREDVKRRLLMKIIAGETPEIAARSVGLTPKELLIYIADDPEFQKHVVACRSEFLGGQEAKIANAPDWRAALEVLKRAKETKENWAAPESGRATIHIELNVPRDTEST